MYRSSRNGRTADERAGRVLLFVPRLLGVVVGLVLILLLTIIAYPFVAVYVFFTLKETFATRFRAAAKWPVMAVSGLLAYNDFVGIGGFDSTWLNRLSTWTRRK